MADPTITSPTDLTEFIVNPQTGGVKGQKLARYDLIPPVALQAVAERFGEGAKKYGDRNWELGYSWSLNFAALNRHLWAFWGGEDLDPETGTPHLDAVIWHAMVLRTFMDIHPEMDDRSSDTSSTPL